MELLHKFENDSDFEDEINFLDYDELKRHLPEDQTVYYYDQFDEPVGWEEIKYGIWFPRRIVMICIPSRHKTETHVTVISFLPEGERHPEIPHRLGFRDHLSSVLEYCCSCRIGSRLAGCCSHVAAALALLSTYSSDPSLFKSNASTKHYFDPMQPPSLSQSLHLKVQDGENEGSDSD